MRCSHLLGGWEGEGEGELDASKPTVALYAAAVSTSSEGNLSKDLRVKVLLESLKSHIRLSSMKFSEFYLPQCRQRFYF